VLWDEWRTYRAVGAGCAGLVPVGTVRGMDHADPVLRNRDTLDVDDLPSDCLIQNAGDDGDAYGPWLFQLLVGEAGETVVARPSAELPERFARLEVPVGGGVSGLAGPNSTTVRLYCSEGVFDVTASAAYTGMASYYPKPATTADRARMASVAVTAADRLAGELVCAGQDHDPQLPEAPRFTSALDTEGTCAWYKPQVQARQHVIWLPDEAMGAPVDGDAWRERCALRLTTDAARHLFDTAYTDTDDDPPTADDLWWADVQTFYDDQDVFVGSTGSTKDTDRPLAPGTAGRYPDTALWWASSVCDGIPAVHVLRVDYGYDSLRAAPHFEQLFRAYVTDVAARRDCTGLEFPSDFTAPAPA
jgi:hypothetical protein